MNELNTENQTIDFQTQQNLIVEHESIDPLEVFPPYTINHDADTNGTGLAVRLLTDNQIRAIETLQPVVSEVSEYSRASGYDGDHWTFTDARGNVFTCYRRDGIMRVGKHGGKWAKPDNPVGTGILRTRYSVRPFLQWLERRGAACAQFAASF